VQMSDVVVMEVVGSETEAEMVCSLLRTAGVQCFHRSTDAGSGAADGMPVGGPRAILVREEDLTAALKVMQGRQG
jgi:Putative prokaryotic signal transducing protein